MNPELENLVSAGRISAAIAEQLSKLEVGAHCNHKSWGVGKIATWDLLGGQLIIDFEDKPGHAMKLEFAAKSLEPLDPAHVLARRYADAETLAAEAVADPEQFVAALLKDFGGSLMLDHFEDVVKGKIIAEGKFKGWWESAKKKLRVNRKFVVPPKRTEPLELRQEDMSPGEAMIADLTEARDLKAKAKASEAVLNDFGAFEVPEVELVPVIEHLNQTIAKAYKMNPGPVVDLILHRDDMIGRAEALKEAVADGVSLVEVIRQHKGDKLREMIGGLSVASLRKLLSALPEAFEDEWVEVALDEFNKSSTRGVSEIGKCIVAAGKQAEFEQYLRNGVRHRSLSADAVVWVCRERKGEALALFDTELAPCIIQTLERDYYDEESVRHKRLHDLLLNDPDLLPDLMGKCDLNQAKTFTRRLMGSPVFEELNRR
ncbi:MAG: hypothetical protein P8J87_06490, partial [Verrucomicrobiales bacterium]|nr:hypothetical protein [Verrucomicrobiales bacterium]